MERQKEGGIELPSAREAVHRAILAHPGSSVSEIARRVDMFWTSVALHVAHLERAGLVRAIRAGRRRVVFPRTPLALEGGPDLALLSEPSCLAVARAIVAHPDRRVWEIGEITSMSERAVYHHVKRLIDAGLVGKRGTSAFRGLRPTDRLIAWIEHRDRP